MMSDTIRCFIAIEIPSTIQTALAKSMSRAQINRDSGFRTVRAESIHLTLKFLGDVPVDKLPGIQNELTTVSKSYQPFTFQIRGLGVFPTWDRPRTIWAGIQHPPVLVNLFQLVDKVTSQAGFPGESRKFSPHLTLARVSERGDAQLIKQRMQNLQTLPEIQFGEVQVTRIVLFKSLLQQGGSVYEAVSIHPFFKEKV
jgi:2'-5' RNA ligase